GFRPSAPFDLCDPYHWFCRGRNFRRSRGVSPDAVLPDAAANYADATQSLFLFWPRISQRLPSITRCIHPWANSAHFQNFIAAPQISQRFDGGFDHVGVIARAERFRQDITDSRRLDHGAHTAARDHARSRRRRPQQHPATTKFTDSLMGDRVLMQRNFFHRLARRLRSLADRFRHFVGFAKTDTHFSVVIARYDQCTKAETTSAFDHLRATINKNDFLGRVAPGRRGLVGAAIGSSAWIRCCHLRILTRLRARHRPALSLCHGKCSHRDQTPRSPLFLPATFPRSPCPHVLPTRDSPPLFPRPNLSAKSKPRPVFCRHRHQSPARKHGGRKNGRRGVAAPRSRSLFSGCAHECAAALPFDSSPLLHRLAFLAP